MFFLIIGVNLIIGALFCLLLAITQIGNISNWIAGYFLSVPLVSSLIITGLFLLGEPIVIPLVSTAIALIIFYIIAMFVALFTIGSIILNHQDYRIRERDEK